MEAIQSVKMRSKLFHIKQFLILAMILATLVKGQQYIQNPDFTSHTSITDIDDWLIIDLGQEDFTVASTYEDWSL